MQPSVTEPVGGAWRSILTVRWFGLAVFMVLAAATMVGLGLWQLDRYHQRSAVNARIDAAAQAQPVPLDRILPDADPAVALPEHAAWTRVTVTGRYDPAHEIIARGRTLNGDVGFEVITPLVLADGSAVLVDRGWLPAPPTGDATTRPESPATPTGEVTVVGRLHAPESRADAPAPFQGHLELRRIDPARIAPTLPYRTYPAYLTMDSQSPPASGFVAVTPDHQNAAMNAGYVVQWWLLAALTLAGLAYLIRREVRDSAATDRAVADLLDGDGGLPEAPVSPAV